MLLNKAEWLGKGTAARAARVEPVIAEPHRAEPVIEPEPIIEPEPAVIEAAAKEEIIEEESILAEIEAEIAAAAIEEEPEPSPAASPAEITEHVLPLAAEPEPVAPQEPAAAPAPVIDVPVEMRGDDIFLMQGDRRYRVRGLNKNMSYELLKVNVLVSGRTPRGESAFHVDTLDLYSARQRSVFTKQAAEELGIKEEVMRRDLGRVLLKLEELQDEQIKQALAPKEEAVTMSERRPGRGDGAAARSALAGPHRRGLRPVRRRGRGDQQTRRLSRRRVAAPGSAAGGDRAVVFRCRQKLADGSGARVPARGAAGAILRDDRPVALLHGRDRPQA